MEPTTKSLSCTYCNKPMKNSSGKTNHERVCQKRHNQENDLMDHEHSENYADDRDYDRNYDRVNGHSGHSGRNGRNGYNNRYNYDNRYDERHDNHRPSREEKREAFMMLSDYPDHIPVLLNIDLAIAIGRAIINSGTRNSAVMAFGHKCLKLGEEFDG